MRLSHVCALTISLVLSAGAAAAQSPAVSIQFQNGLVTLTARNAPLRTILQEWARVGRASIVNAERVTGTPLTIELVNVPEQEALATLLRGVTGYIVGARQVASTGPSSFDRIMILPGSSAAVAARPANNPQPAAPPPQPIAFVPGEAEDASEIPLTAAQLQNQIREANARAAAPRIEMVPANEPPRPAQPAGAQRNPFFTGSGSGRPGEITPAPQPRNPLRPNGDPEP